ncbi:MAG: hypothetical protein M3O46_01540 [Myxococcota bacterium]|nr:hypothetical protein [Myxococcota bacterium]
MNAVNPTTPIANATTNTPSTTQATSSAPSLLSDPMLGALAGADPMSMLYLFESKDQQLSVQAGTSKIAALQSERHQALQQEQQAIQQAADAANHHSFWDSLGSICGEVAKVAAVVASIAAAVVTWGAATPIAALAIAGAVLSTAAFADGELHVMQSLGVNAETAGWIDTGMAIGGAVMSCGAGMFAGANVASSTGTILSKASSVVAAAGAIGKGASTVVAGKAQAQSDLAAADEVAAQARSNHAQRIIQTIIDETQTSDEESRRIMGTISNTKTIQSETTLAAATAVRG